MRVKDAVGRYGEQVAADHLVAAGLTIIERNWRCRDGEIDVVARDGDCLVVVEVKTRTGTTYGSPAQAVDGVKRARLRRLAIRWMQEHREDGFFWTAVRFDVVSVVRRPGVGPEVVHLSGAF